MVRCEVFAICWLLALLTVARAEETAPPSTEQDATDAAIDLPSDDQVTPRLSIDGDRIDLLGREIQQDYPVARPVTDGVGVTATAVRSPS